MEPRRRPKTAAPSARPIAGRADVFAALVALGVATAADAAPPAPSVAATSAPSSEGLGAGAAAPSASAAPSAAPAPEQEIPVPDLGSGATLRVTEITPNAKAILYVDGRPVPPFAWHSLPIAPGIHEVVMDYPNGEAALDKRRISVAAGGPTDLQFGHDPSVVEQLGGAQPIEQFSSGSGCCGTHAPVNSARAALPISLLAAAILVARRRRRGPTL